MVAEAAAAIDAATLTMHSGLAAAEALVAKGDRIPQEYVLRTRRDMTHAQHQVQWAVEKLLTVLTHSIASRQAAMGAWGRSALGVG